MIIGMSEKKKTSLELETLPILRQRAAEDGTTMSAWVDELVRREDLRRRIAADRKELAAAGLHDPAQVDAIARAAMATRQVGQ